MRLCAELVPPRPLDKTIVREKSCADVMGLSVVQGESYASIWGSFLLLFVNSCCNCCLLMLLLLLLLLLRLLLGRLPKRTKGT